VQKKKVLWFGACQASSWQSLEMVAGRFSGLSLGRSGGEETIASLAGAGEDVVVEGVRLRADSPPLYLL
jgi:hypothetical protein